MRTSREASRRDGATAMPRTSRRRDASRDVRAALTVAAAWGYAGEAELANAHRVADRLGGVLYGLVAKLA